VNRIMEIKAVERIRPVLWSLAVVAAAVSGSPAAPAGEGEWIRVPNGAEPAEGVDTVHLEEAWRVGGDEGDDIFGLVTQVVVAGDGTIYLLDTRLSEIAVYSPRGERLTTLSREGDGPGESRGPTNLLLMPDGTLGLVQMFPGKVVKVARDGTPAGEFRPGADDPTAGGFLRIFDCASDGRRVILVAETISETAPGVQDRTNFVAAFDAEGRERARYCQSVEHVDYSAFVVDEDTRKRISFRRVAVDPDGRVYVARERNAYAVEVYAPDGTPDRIITRDYEHRPRTELEYRRIKTSYENQLRRLPDPRISISRNRPDILAVEVDRDGNLRVATSRSATDQPDGVMFTWDVFTPDGRFLKQLAAACPGDGENDRLIWTPSGDAVLVTGYEEARFNGQGAAAADEDAGGEAAPMEIVYLRRLPGGRVPSK